MYNLQTQTLVKRLRTGVKWLSSMAVHPGGDNLIVGSFDRRLAWFDLDLSPAPYKTLRYHSFALRQVRKKGTDASRDIHTQAETARRLGTGTEMYTDTDSDREGEEEKDDTLDSKEERPCQCWKRRLCYAAVKDAD